MSISSTVAVLAPPERAVLLSFTFYLLNLLVPIVPAVIIYRLFPEGKIGVSAAKKKRRTVVIPQKRQPREKPAASSVEGNVGGWKIKAVGAWGAYVTAFLLGFWAINNTAIPLIKAVGGASVWVIDSDVKFLDENGAEITNVTTDTLQVEPPEVKPWGKHASITVFSQTMDPPPQIKVRMPGYDYKIVDLRKATSRDGNQINVSEITLKKLPKTPPDKTLESMPEGVGPPALTKNP